MQLKRFIANILEENIYLLHNENKDCVVIDPGGTDISEVITYIKDNELNLKSILITHGHFDHTKSINNLLNYKKVPVYIGKDDIEIMFSSINSMSRAFIGEEVNFNEDIEIIAVSNGDNIFGLECISTPGHTKGSTCYYSKEDKMIFTGDTLFKNAYGRTDFPTGNPRELRDSLSVLLNMDENTVIYPGHGDKTTVKEEYNNYYSLYY